jgi:hypothetical protein
MSANRELKFSLNEEKSSNKEHMLYTIIPLIVLISGVALLVISLSFGDTLNAAQLGISIAMVAGPAIFWYYMFLMPREKEIILDQENGVLKRVKSAEWLKKDKINAISINDIKEFEREVNTFTPSKGGQSRTTYIVWLIMRDEGKFKLLASEFQEDMDNLLKWLEIHLKPML